MPKSKFRNQILVTVMSAILFTVTVLYLLIANDVHKLNQNYQAEQQQQIKRYLQINLPHKAFRKDFVAIQQFLNTLVKEFPEIQAIEFEEPGGRIRAHIGAEINRSDDVHKTQYQALSVGTQHVGLVFYQVNLDNKKLLDVTSLWDLAIVMMTLLLLVALILLRVLQPHSRAITQLNQYCQELTHNYSALAPTIEDDELRPLVNTLRKLQTDIEYQSYATQNEKTRLFSLLNSMNIGVVFEDQRHLIQYSNDAFAKCWNLFDEIQGQNLQELLLQHPQILKENRQSINDFYDTLIALKDGRTIRCQITEVKNRQLTLGRLWLFEDVTETTTNQKKMAFLASHDSLTGLHNRRYFLQNLREMRDLARNNQRQLALIICDVDDFKFINDSFGHQAGDYCLAHIANILKNNTHESDWVGRLDGDEFAIITIVDDAHSAERMASKISQDVRKKISNSPLEGFVITTSIGVSTYPKLSDSLESLSIHADTAVYEAKANGKGHYKLYNPNRNTMKKQQTLFIWRDRIEQALRQDLFELHFQAIFDHDHQISHLESLIRYPDPENPGCYFSPGDFVHVAEKSGQVLEVDRFVVQHSIETLANHPTIPSIAVNLSGRSLNDHELVRFIAKHLNLNKIDPERLLLEITETSAIMDISIAEDFLHQLKILGCKVCLDDFGSGFSSFNYLKKLKVDYLKIDGTLIHKLDTDTENQLFVKSMTHIAQQMGMKTIAEFIEEAVELEMAKQLNVSLFQGYHLHAPCPIDELLTQLNQEAHPRQRVS